MPTNTNDKNNANDTTTGNDMAAILQAMQAMQAELAELRQQTAENANKANKAVTAQFGQTGKQQVEALTADMASLAGITDTAVIAAVVDNTIANAKPAAKTLTLQVRLLGSLLAAQAATTQAKLVKSTYDLLSSITDVAPATVSAQLGRLASPTMYSNYAHKPFDRLSNGCLSLPVPRSEATEATEPNKA